MKKQITSTKVITYEQAVIKLLGILKKAYNEYYKEINKGRLNKKINYEKNNKNN